jgi:hypothetical protein
LPDLYVGFLLCIAINIEGWLKKIWRKFIA